jgi:hypothetical protein
VPSSSSHSWHPYPFHCHSTSSSVPSTTLDIQHRHSWWDALPCHYDPHWLNTAFIFLGFWTWTHEKDSRCSPQMVFVMLRFLNTYVQEFCFVFVVWLVWVHYPFLDFNLWIGPGFIFYSCSFFIF